MALTDNLRAAYNLDDVTDSTGNGYDLTNTGSATFDSGLIGDCVEFGSSNSSKRVGIASGLGVGTSDDWTISYWFRSPSVSVITAPIMFVYGGGTKHCTFMYDGANSRWFYFTSWYATSRTHSQALSTNTWYNVILVNSGGTITPYINNSAITTIPLGSTSGRSDVFQTYDVNNWWHQGDMDIINVWNRAIDSGERSDIYNAGAGVEYPFSGGGVVKPQFLGFARM
jgi:hypothetical protein